MNGNSVASWLRRDQRKKGGKLELRAITNSHRIRESPVMMSSTTPSARYSCSASPQLGFKDIARMLADGTITARIRSTVELDGVSQMLEKLRHGGLRGKAVISF